MALMERAARGQLGGAHADEGATVPAATAAGGTWQLTRPKAVWRHKVQGLLARQLQQQQQQRQGQAYSPCLVAGWDQ
jgi:hypothetical protein